MFLCVPADSTYNIDPLFHLAGFAGTRKQE